MSEAKPYNIPKQLVWDAYQRVKANRGAAGVDGESLAAFEQDLKGNLYKVWNRMSSGSYFPPPVRLVEIAKDNGGTRPLGIPTVADRVCQTVAKMVLEPLVEPVFHPDSYGYRPGKSALDAVGWRGSAAGTPPGSSTWISKRSLVRQGKPGASSGCNSRPGKGNEPSHLESSLGLMEATTWAKRRQSDVRAVTQVKRLSLVTWQSGGRQGRKLGRHQ